MDHAFSRGGELQGGLAMAVREFKDDEGKLWRAWDVRPEAIHPQTRAEDFLTECYVIGWIVFQTTGGDEKRRLCPWPASWAREPDAGLRALLAKAEPVPPRKLDAERQAAGVEHDDQLGIDVPAEQDKLDVTDLRVVRSFRYPGGRLWTVCVVDYPEDGGPAALRFTAGVRSIDLRPWPKDWADLPDERLVQLLRIGLPRQESDADPVDERRWQDRPAN